MGPAALGKKVVDKSCQPPSKLVLRVTVLCLFRLLSDDGNKAR